EGRAHNCLVHYPLCLQKKIFMIQGRYPVIRCLLRQRGWVEKKMLHPLGTTLSPPQKDLDRSVTADSDATEDEDEDEDEVFPPPQPFDFDDLLEFDDLDGTHALMSRMVRNEIPYFIWTTRRDVLDCRFLSKDQVINHYAKAGSFTTKVGLCLNLRNLPWFDEADADTFFPRCYRLGAEDDKKAFIGKEMPSPRPQGEGEGPGSVGEQRAFLFVPPSTPAELPLPPSSSCPNVPPFLNLPACSTQTTRRA
uniref:Tubulin tyrosine ligase like 3 n=1 Tax=Rhinolophus ferrumequinum TaxID=59479 RepID=A0A671F459_RHIFE